MFADHVFLVDENTKVWKDGEFGCLGKVLEKVGKYTSTIIVPTTLFH